MRNALPLVTAVVIGVLLWVLDIGLKVDAASQMSDTAKQYLFRQVPIVAVLVWVLTALRRRPWAAVLAALLGSFSPLGLPAACLALASLISRRQFFWSVAGGACTIIGAVASCVNLSRPTMPHGECLVYGLFGGTFVVMLSLLVGWSSLNSRRDAQELARADERTRIARDMHDSLAHRLSLISIYAAAVDKHPETATTIKQQVHLAGDDLRSILTMLRPDTDPQQSLTTLVEEAQAAGQTITLDLLAEPDTTTAEAHFLNRTLTEGLTNARKHAPGCSVGVTIDTKRLTIRTLGIPNHHGHGTGMGLVGIRERARLVGATVTVDSGVDHVLDVRLKA